MNTKRETLIDKIKNSNQLQCYLLIALPLIGFVVFSIYPMLWSASKAFFYYDKNPNNTKFVGLDNFIKIFVNDKEYWLSWLTTVKFALYKLPFEIPMALVIAYLLNMVSNKPGTAYRAIYCMPNIISTAIVGVIFTSLFDYYGCMNSFFQKIGIIKDNIDWFGSPKGALFVLIAGSCWCNIGINILYFSAALSNVPREIYEAAEIDGANGIEKLIKITIPMIAPVFQTILLLAINGSLHTGEFVITLTNGAPGGTTHTVGSYMIASFLPGFASGTPNVGYGCALSIVMSLICSAVAVLYLKFSEKMKNVY